MWRRPSPSPRQLRLAWLTELVRAIHADSRGTYGWRRVNAELVYGHGVVVNRKTVQKIMRAQGLHGLPGAGKSFRSKAHMATTADLVERRFDWPALDQLWVTDITEHPTREGKLYCCVVLDVFSRRVVGIRIAVFYTRLYSRLLPLTAADQPQAPADLRAALATITRHVHDYATRARLPQAA
jgi:putative transposase